MGIMRRLASIQLARPGLGEPATQDDEAYLRWYHRFVAIFAFIAILAMVLALADTDVALGRRLAAIGLTMGLMAWFWWRGQWHQLTSDAKLVLYLVGMLVAVVLAIRMWDGSGLLLFSAYWLGFAYCRLWPALVYSALLTVGSQWAFGAFENFQWSDFSISTSVVLGFILALVVSGMMAGYIEMFSRESDRRAQLLEELQAAQSELAEQEREAGMRQERDRLAAEIHDTIAQHFTSIVTNLTAAENRYDANPEASQHHVESALSAARQGITDSRRMVRALQPEILSGRTLSQALREIATASVTDGTDVRFEESGRPAQMNRLHEAILVRALQESLLNIRKHAAASLVSVSLTWEDEDMILDITDNGAGFVSAHVHPSPEGHQMGLATMRARAEGAGGTWMLDSTPSEGTSLAISFPVESRQEGVGE